MAKCSILSTMGLGTCLVPAWPYRVHPKLTPQLALLEGQSLRVDHDWYSIR